MADEQTEIVKVEVVNSEKIAAAEFGSWLTLELLGTEAAQQLLPQAPLRDRAVILIQGAPGNKVRVGTQEQVQNGGGGTLIVPCSVTKESQPAVWVAPIGGLPVTVTVLDERYQDES